MGSGAVRDQSSGGTLSDAGAVERAGGGLFLVAPGVSVQRIASAPSRSAPKECAPFGDPFSVRMDSKRRDVRTRIHTCGRVRIYAGALAAVAPSRALAASALADTDAAPAQRFRGSPQQETFLDQLQRDTFKLLLGALRRDGAHARSRSPASDVSSVAAIGFALTSYVVGVERGYVARAEAAARTLATLETLWRAPQGSAAEGVSGYQGLFYHFLDTPHGIRRQTQSELATIDTALLMAGVLSSQAYFDREDGTEQSIRSSPTASTAGSTGRGRPRRGTGRCSAWAGARSQASST